METQRPSGDLDDYVYLSLERLIDEVGGAVPVEGGFVTVAGLVSRMPSTQQLPEALRVKVVGRVLECMAAIQRGKRSFPAFVEVNFRTRKVTRPRRPNGVAAIRDKDALIFEPLGDRPIH